MSFFLWISQKEDGGLNLQPSRFDGLCQIARWLVDYSICHHVDRVNRSIFKGIKCFWLKNPLSLKICIKQVIASIDSIFSEKSRQWQKYESRKRFSIENLASYLGAFHNWRPGNFVGFKTLLPFVQNCSCKISEILYECHLLLDPLPQYGWTTFMEDPLAK